MTTTLEIELSAQMQTWLTQGATPGAGNGVSVFAILYGSTTPGGSADTPLSTVTLVDNGTVNAGGSFSIDLTTTTQPQLYGGKVYFIIQSVAEGTAAIDPTTLSQSAITWGNAAALGYRYDSIEVSLTGAAGDAANLTSIEGFGIGMTLEAETGSRSYAVSASQMFDSLAGAATDTQPGMSGVDSFSAGGLQGEYREAVSPAVAVVPANGYPVYSTDDWLQYVDALKHPDTRIVVNGYFNGAADLQANAPAGTASIWRNAGFFSYELHWIEKDNTFWLIPTEGSQIQGAIRLTAEALSQSIYSTLGTVELYETIGAASPFEIYPGSTEMNTGANNAWGQALQQLTLGLTAGYLQSQGTSQNDAVSAAIDLNKNYNWDPSYAYGQNTNSLLPDDVLVTWDPYSQLFFANSNSYGTQYADALMNAFAQGGPQLPTYANGQNVSTMKVTLFADGETPPAGDYTAPVIYDYVAGSEAGGQYAPAVWYESNPANVTLNFNPGNSLAQSLVLKDGVALSIRILTGYDGDTPQFQEVALGGAGTTPWQTWTFAYDDGSYSVSGNGGAGQTSQSLVLTGLPMAASGVGWYQIVVRFGDFEKAFNLYTTTFTPGAAGSIPLFSDFGSDPSLFGIDGLAMLTPGTAQDGGLVTFSVDVTGVSPTIDLSLMRANTSSGFLTNQVKATAPVAGTQQGGIFTALAGQTADVHDGGGGGVDLSAVSQSGLLAFGWTGLNDAPDTATWTETFTNLIQGKSIAVVRIADQGGSLVGALHAKADLAGGWHTMMAQQLGNGTYDVTMSAYAARPKAPNLPDYAEPLTRDSAVLTVQVALSDLELKAGAGGRALELISDDSGTEGNWIHIAATTDALNKGVAVALYATNASGQPIGTDGQPVTGIQHAVRGWVGAVGGDGGGLMFDGAQAVYLGAGQQLRFAMVGDDGALSPAGTVAVSGAEDGTFSLDIDGLRFDAVVQNTLSVPMQQAAVQRMFGLPLVQAEHGQSFSIELAGSAANVNTLGFVRLDLDQATGAISLDDIAYGDTDAFRSAVHGALDKGFAVTAGGTDFVETTTWTVAGEDGYYVPVLITQSGEIFVPGIGNQGGQEYIRIFGENTFGFEDLAAEQGSDFDYNDMVMRLVPHL